MTVEIKDQDMSQKIPIIDKLGGADAVVHALSERGHDIKYRAVRYWIEKGIIPAQRQRQLIEIADERRISTRLSDFHPSSDAHP